MLESMRFAEIVNTALAQISIIADHSGHAQHHHFALYLLIFGGFFLFGAAAMGMRSIMADSVTIRPESPEDGIVTRTVRGIARFENGSLPFYTFVAKSFLALAIVTLALGGILYLIE